MALKDKEKQDYDSYQSMFDQQMEPVEKKRGAGGTSGRCRDVFDWFGDGDCGRVSLPAKRECVHFAVDDLWLQRIWDVTVSVIGRDRDVVFQWQIEGRMAADLCRSDYHFRRDHR